MAVECENCIGQRASECQGVFYFFSESLEAMTRAAESLAERTDVANALDFGQVSKQHIIADLSQVLTKIGCQLTPEQTNIRLQEEFENL
jgi:hypothetical protein